MDERGAVYRYREYRKEPLSADEIRGVLDKLGVGPKAVLRKNDRAYRELELTGTESDEALVDLLAVHPAEGRLVVGRPEPPEVGAGQGQRSSAICQW